MKAEILHSDEYSDEVKFAISLAQDMLQYGIPSHRIEDSLEKLCQKLDVDADFLVHSGAIFVSIQENSQYKQFMYKPKKIDIDLERLILLDRLAINVVKGKVSCKEALEEMHLIENLSERYPGWAHFLAFVFSSGAAAILFGGGIAELLVAGLSGMLIVFTNMLTGSNRELNKLFILISAFIAMGMAELGALIFPDLNVGIASVTGMIVLIPGFSFTIGMTELATGHPISGTSRISNAMVTFLMIGFGIALASYIIDHLGLSFNQYQFYSIPKSSFWLALLVVPIGFTILFKARWQDLKWIIIICLTSFLSTKIPIESVQLSSFASALIVGLVSNIFARILNQPAILMLVPGIIILVPGSIGFSSITTMLDNQTMEAISTALKMIFIAISLAAGLIASNVIVPSKRPL